MTRGSGQNFLYEDQGAPVGRARAPDERQPTDDHDHREAHRGEAAGAAGLPEVVGVTDATKPPREPGTAGPTPAFRACAGAPAPARTRAPDRHTDAGLTTARLGAPRPEPSAPTLEECDDLDDATQPDTATEAKNERQRLRRTASGMDGGGGCGWEGGGGSTRIIPAI